MLLWYLMWSYNARVLGMGRRGGVVLCVCVTVNKRICVLRFCVEWVVSWYWVLHPFQHYYVSVLGIDKVLCVCYCRRTLVCCSCHCVAWWWCVSGYSVSHVCCPSKRYYGSARYWRSGYCVAVSLCHCVGSAVCCVLDVLRGVGQGIEWVSSLFSMLHVTVLF